MPRAYAEIIWARNYDSELNVTHYMNSYFINQQYANYAFTRQFINTYLMTDGTPFTDKYPDYDASIFVAEVAAATTVSHRRSARRVSRATAARRSGLPT